MPSEYSCREVGNRALFLISRGVSLRLFHGAMTETESAVKNRSHESENRQRQNDFDERKSGVGSAIARFVMKRPLSFRVTQPYESWSWVRFFAETECF